MIHQTWLWGTVSLACLVASGAAGPPRFLPDDPIAVDAEAHDARAVKVRGAASGIGADVQQQLAAFGRARDERARNLNTIDEVPDSSWFTNRLVTRAAASREPGQLCTGAADRSAPAWTIIAADARGPLPELTASDPEGHHYTLTFDHPDHAELATGAALVAAQLLAAAGYHVPCHRLQHITREQLSISGAATMADDIGRRRRMTAGDLDLLLARAARRDDGRYRVVVRQAPAGVSLGPFGYAGMRADDPNDHIPHEHRRELRGLRVFAAWLNHDATAAFGTQDVLTEEAGRYRVRHYLVDVGATLGSGTTLVSRTFAANEEAWRRRRKLRTTLTLGFAVRPWERTTYPPWSSVGLFEATSFDPERWQPAYGNAAFAHARGDDHFWAARRVASFNDEAIRDVVAAAQYSEPAAGDYLSRTIIARRDKIAAAWLNTVLPLVDCALSNDGWLTCSPLDATGQEEEARAISFTIRWYRYDNASDRRDPVGTDETIQGQPRFAAPVGLLTTPGMIAVEIAGRHPRHKGWETPMQVFFRRASEGWQVVGLERQP